MTLRDICRKLRAKAVYNGGSGFYLFYLDDIFLLRDQLYLRAISGTGETREAAIIAYCKKIANSHLLSHPYTSKRKELKVGTFIGRIITNCPIREKDRRKDKKCR